MSWFFGLISNKNIYEKEFKEKIPAEGKVLRSENSIIAFGGLFQTCKSIVLDKKGIIFCGLGISNLPAPDFISEDFLSNNFKDINKLKKLNGHFACLKWEHNKIELFNDKYGLRDIYFYETKENIYYSTDLLLLTKFIPSTEIDYNEFSSKWLLVNQLSFNSIIKNVKRLGPSGYAVIENNNLKIINEFQQMQSNEYYSLLDFKNALYTLTNFPAKTDLTLGLSGGLDSRVLLSLLLDEKINFSVHTFGLVDQKELKIAKKITNKKNLKHIFIANELPDSDKCVNIIEDIIPHLNLVNPISDIFDIPLHKKLYNKNKIIIDGGFGEIFRRQFFNKLLFFGKDALLNNNIDKIYEQLIYKRADIFIPEIKSQMIFAAKESLASFIKTLPEINEIGIENWLDLFALNTRAANVYETGQSYLDNICVAFMPFLQPDLIRIGLNVPTVLRKDGKMFKEIIKSSNSRLNKFPLVKNEIQYPFSSSNLSERIIIKLKKKLISEKTNVKIDLLNKLETYVKDIIYSSETKNYAPYNYNYVKNIVEKYYLGETKYSDELDWFLTFEIYRKNLFNNL